MWILTNLAMGTHDDLITLLHYEENIMICIEKGLLSEDKHLRDTTFWMVGNMTGDSTEIAQHFLEHSQTLNVIEAILSMGRTKLNTLKLITWIASNLAKLENDLSEDQVNLNSFLSTSIQFFRIAYILKVSLLSQDKDEDALKDALFGISYLIKDRDDDQVMKIVDIDLIRTLT